MVKPNGIVSVYLSASCLSLVRPQKFRCKQCGQNVRPFRFIFIIMHVSLCPYYYQLACHFDGAGTPHYSKTVRNIFHAPPIRTGHILWWQRLDKLTLYVLLSVLIALLLIVIVVCIIIICICRKRRRQNKCKYAAIYPVIENERGRYKYTSLILYILYYSKFTRTHAFI